ncbi:MAG: SHOCT domain-containing protein [Ilumatobacteraceae bacterium]
MLANAILSQTDGWGHMNGWGGGWMWLWGVGMMTLVVVLIVWLVRAAGTDSTGVAEPPRREPNDRAREILGERFATGELSSEEYRERVSELQ